MRMGPGFGSSVLPELLQLLHATTAARVGLQPVLARGFQLWWSESRRVLNWKLGGPEEEEQLRSARGEERLRGCRTFNREGRLPGGAQLARRRC